MRDDIKLKCGFNVKLLLNSKIRSLKRHLESLLTHSFYDPEADQGKKIKLDEKNFFAETECHLEKRNCQNLVYLDSNYYCCKQDELKKIYQNSPLKISVDGVYDLRTPESNRVLKYKK